MVFIGRKLEIREVYLKFEGFGFGWSASDVGLNQSNTSGKAGGLKL